MLLRAKENEIEYLHKEISCLRSEIQSLIKVWNVLGIRSSARCYIFSVAFICLNKNPLSIYFNGHFRPEAFTHYSVSLLSKAQRVTCDSLYSMCV